MVTYVLQRAEFRCLTVRSVFTGKSWGNCLGLSVCAGEKTYLYTVLTLSIRHDRPEHPAVSDKTTGPSCSKLRKLNELVSGQNVNCFSKNNI